MHNNILPKERPSWSSWLFDRFLCSFFLSNYHCVFVVTSGTSLFLPWLLYKEKGPLRRRAQVRYNGVKVFSKVVFSYLFTDVFATHKFWYIKDSKLEKKCTKNGIRLQKDFSMSDLSDSSTNIPWPKSRLDSRYDCALCRLAGGGSGSATVPSEHTCLWAYCLKRPCTA